ncbi:MAG: hypothetical protein ABI467_16460 [Kofleriaceae bacterium]
MRVPIWVTLGVALIVIAFGLYRIWVSLQKIDPEAPVRRSLMGGGFYRMSPRTHLVIGVLYLALGGALVATSFGWNPFGGSAPAAPSSVPVELKK